MSKSAAKKIVVCGGNGFLGSRICKFAVARGWDVTSISRSGEPKWSAVTASSTPPSWAHKVSWESADIFQPTAYAPLLKGADYIVHSMGILLEADYKGVVSGQESPIAGLRKAFDSTRGSPNPLERDGGTDNYKAPENEKQLTYENMNRDSAVLVARAAEQGIGDGESAAAATGGPAFLYVSAAGGAPVLPRRYIDTKREAESLIASGFPRMRGIFLRPPFLYDSSRPFTIPMAAMTGVGAVFNGLTRGVFGGLMGAAGAKPLKVDVVAQAAVEALSDESVRGPVEVPEIEELANKGWRKDML
ncbi:NAD dependent epimerase/dehydratase [Diaporthe helianthi]|uniref:NAD dependent epimerase/dehydratase n=1 Tax=Diaporthe helianthi TaxID=158607 RepID=A0A2P5HZN9_DIAHE|nr:NAD dependent epimerase/dehydratase [Diaporthe helianthi]